MSRIQARETVFKLTYEYLFLKIYNKETLNSLSSVEDLEDTDREFINNAYTTII